MTDYRVLITGSRDWGDEDVIKRALELATFGKSRRRTVIIHGAAKGADRLAGAIAEGMGLHVEAYPADWDTHGRAAGPIRNQQMVDLGADICLAFPLGESRGTRHCMQAAEKAGIEVINYGD